MAGGSRGGRGAAVGQAEVVVRPAAEGEAARERRRPARAGYPVAGGRWPVAGEKKGGVDDGDGWIGWRLKMMVGHRILIGRLQIRVWKESKILGYAVDSP